MHFRPLPVVIALALLVNTASTTVYGGPLLSDSHHLSSAGSEDNAAALTTGTLSTTQDTSTTSRLSIASDGTQGNELSTLPSVSADGRYVAFASQASNLVGGDTNGVYDIFVRDRWTGQTSRISIASDSTQGNGLSFVSFISADGRYIAFRSVASNLVSGDTNNQDDVFVHDRQTGDTVRVSVNSNGVQGNGPSIKPSLSADARYVAFESWATNLVSDTNNMEDVFVHDLQTHQTSRVSIASNGAQANDQSDLPFISTDGRYVVFASEASNLVSGDTNNVCDTNNDGVFNDNCPDIFIHDRQTGQTSRVSVASDGTQGNGWCRRSSLSADGRYVAFESQASSLVSGDTNGIYDIFVHDRQTGQTARVSVTSDGAQGNGESEGPFISADGRYVAFESWASNLVSGDTNAKKDVFVHDRQTGQTVRVSVASGGMQANNDSGGVFLSGAGRYVAFSSLASNLTGGDTNGRQDVFIHDRGIGPGTTITVPLVSDSDDAGVELGCIYQPDWSEIYFGRCTNGDSIISGFRFQNVPIAPGAAISEAYVEFTIDGLYNDDIAVILFGQASTNSAPFSYADRPSDRPLTTTSVNWNIPASDIWNVDESRRSPGMAAIVQEIVNRPDWVGGNSLTIIARANPAIAGNAHRRVFAWEREMNSDHTARLVVVLGEWFQVYLPVILDNY